MNKMKKGQGMSLNVIVIAALVVLVLIVLSIIFVRSSGSFSSDLQSCASKGGTCVPAVSTVPTGIWTDEGTTTTTRGCPDGMSSIRGSCPEQEEHLCCIKI